MRSVSTSRITLSFLLFFSFITISGCFQYPEGPWFTLQTKDERFGGYWIIDQVIDPNGADVTVDYANYTLLIQVTRDTKNLTLFKDGVLNSFGAYTFAEHSDDLVIIYTQYQGVDVSKEVLEKIWTIRRLTDKWLYYIDENGYEWHWKKN